MGGFGSLSQQRHCSRGEKRADALMVQAEDCGVVNEPEHHWTRPTFRSAQLKVGRLLPLEPESKKLSYRWSNAFIFVPVHLLDERSRRGIEQGYYQL
jgi:hypothetical protein